MINVNINYTFHFVERVKERMNISIQAFDKFWNHNTKMKIFHGKYEKRDKHPVTHYLTEYEGKYFVVIREQKNFITLLTEELYRTQSWAVPLSPHIETFEAYKKQRGTK